MTVCQAVYISYNFIFTHSVIPVVRLSLSVLPLESSYFHILSRQFAILFRPSGKWTVSFRVILQLQFIYKDATENGMQKCA